MSRIDALRIVSSHFSKEPLVLTCGATSREMAHADRRANHLYVVDSMGLVSSIALGLSLAHEECASVQKCVGVEGDGGMFMNLNALSTIGYLRPAKLLLIVLDNESYASTGGQPTFTERLDLSAVAASCGLKIWRAGTGDELEKALTAAKNTPGPGFVLMKIARGNTSVPYLKEDPVLLGSTFRKWLQERSPSRNAESEER